MIRCIMLLLLCFSLLPGNLAGERQDKPEGGNPYLIVYSNFRKGIHETDKTSAFEVRRVYLGYSGRINENFAAEVKLDIGSPEDLSQYSLIRRYAYFKTAALTYKHKRITAYFGLFDMLQFKTQEQFWGYRYIAKSFQDEYKFGSSADIGAGLKYRISDRFEADLVVSNGEGYNNLQSDDNFNTGTGLTYKSPAGLVLRAYYDFIREEHVQSDMIFFAGYQKDTYRIGAEYNMKYNSAYIEDHNLTGYSVYGAHKIKEKWEVFGRYDILRSNVLPEEDQPWNLKKDLSSVITGIQFKPNENVKMSLNYQDFYSFAKNGTDKAFLYFNVQFSL